MIHNSVSLPELAFMLETFSALVSWKYHSLPYLSLSDLQVGGAQDCFWKDPVFKSHYANDPVGATDAVRRYLRGRCAVGLPC